MKIGMPAYHFNAQAMQLLAIHCNAMHWSTALLKTKKKLAEEQEKRAADATIQACASEEVCDEDSEDSSYEDSEDGSYADIEDGYDDDNVALLDFVSRVHNYDDGLIDTFLKFLEHYAAKPL